MDNHFDVIIIGGGIMGSSTAFFLASNSDFKGTIAVIEKDPSYEKSATALSLSSYRQQFSTPINIKISQFGYQFLKNCKDILSVGNDKPDISLVESTYLYLATSRGQDILKQNAAIQQQEGVPVHLLSPSELVKKYPWINPSDIICATMTSYGEGWFDAYALLIAFKKKAQSLGVRYIKDEVVNVTIDSNMTVHLQSGKILPATWVVNASGTYGQRLAKHVGIDIPIFPRKRCVFVFDCREEIEDCPLVIDPTGLYFRKEGQYYLTGIPPDPDPNVEPNDFRINYDLFEEVIWPILAKRVKAFEAIKMLSSWVGHYDFNEFDQNAFIGPVPGEPHFLLCNGFSGHGLQQAPAVGRGLAEQIVYGAYKTLDLTQLSYQRYLDNRPFQELNII